MSVLLVCASAMKGSYSIAKCPEGSKLLWPKVICFVSRKEVLSTSVRMHACVCHSWLGWLGMVDRIKCFTVFRNILDEIINYLLGCRGMLKYFFRAQISKQHVWCMWNIYCGDYFIYQVHFLVDVCMPVAFSDQPSCVLVFGCDLLRIQKVIFFILLQHL